MGFKKEGVGGKTWGWGWVINRVCNGAEKNKNSVISVD
jgi:hypothetical protein